MKAVMLSVQPKWCELIANGEKTVEVRKTRPKLEAPFKVYIYCTKGKDRLLEIIKEGDEFFGEVYKGKTKFIKGYESWFTRENGGKVIGEFICDEIHEFESEFWDDETYEAIREVITPEDFAEHGEYEYKMIASNDWQNHRKNWLCKESCVSWKELRKYIGTGINIFYGWHISQLKIYDEPKGLWKFFKPCDGCDKIGTMRCTEELSPCRSKVLTRPPQSWCYTEERRGGKNETY